LSTVNTNIDYSQKLTKNTGGFYVLPPFDEETGTLQEYHNTMCLKTVFIQTQFKLFLEPVICPPCRGQSSSIVPIVWLLSHAPEKTSKMQISVKVSMLCKVLAQSINIPCKKHGMHNSSKVQS
jgi:hypothetical protein